MNQHRIRIHYVNLFFLLSLTMGNILCGAVLAISPIQLPANQSLAVLPGDQYVYNVSSSLRMMQNSTTQNEYYPTIEFKDIMFSQNQIWKYDISSVTGNSLTYTREKENIKATMINNPGKLKAKITPDLYVPTHSPAIQTISNNLSRIEHILEDPFVFPREYNFSDSIMGNQAGKQEYLQNYLLGTLLDQQPIDQYPKQIRMLEIINATAFTIEYTGNFSRIQSLKYIELDHMGPIGTYRIRFMRQLTDRVEIVIKLQANQRILTDLNLDMKDAWCDFIDYPVDVLAYLKIKYIYTISSPSPLLRITTESPENMLTTDPQLWINRFIQFKSENVLPEIRILNAYAFENGYSLEFTYSPFLESVLRAGTEFCVVEYTERYRILGTFTVLATEPSTRQIILQYSENPNIFMGQSEFSQALIPLLKNSYLKTAATVPIMYMNYPSLFPNDDPLNKKYETLIPDKSTINRWQIESVTNIIENNLSTNKINLTIYQGVDFSDFAKVFPLTNNSDGESETVIRIYDWRPRITFSSLNSYNLEGSIKNDFMGWQNENAFLGSPRSTNESDNAAFDAFLRQWTGKSSVWDWEKGGARMDESFMYNSTNNSVIFQRYLDQYENPASALTYSPQRYFKLILIGSGWEGGDEVLMDGYGQPKHFPIQNHFMQQTNRNSSVRLNLTDNNVLESLIVDEFILIESRFIDLRVEITLAGFAGFPKFVLDDHRTYYLLHFTYAKTLINPEPSGWERFLNAFWANWVNWLLLLISGSVVGTALVVTLKKIKIRNAQARFIQERGGFQEGEFVSLNYLEPIRINAFRTLNTPKDYGITFATYFGGIFLITLGTTALIPHAITHPSWLFLPIIGGMGIITLLTLTYFSSLHAGLRVMRSSELTGQKVVGTLIWSIVIIIILLPWGVLASIMGFLATSMLISRRHQISVFRAMGANVISGAISAAFIILIGGMFIITFPTLLSFFPTP